jgi:hypothetical protein
VDEEERVRIERLGDDVWNGSKIVQLGESKQDITKNMNLNQELSFYREFCKTIA